MALKDPFDYFSNQFGSQRPKLTLAMGADRGRGHTHDTRDRRKQAEKNARKQEQKKNNNNDNFNYKNIKIPEDINRQFIVCVSKYCGDQIVRVKKENEQNLDVFISGKCRLRNRRRQNVTKNEGDAKKYLLVEKLEILIRTAGDCTHSLIHAYTKSEMKELKHKKNKNEPWYWKVWEEEAAEFYDYNNDNSDFSDSDKNNVNNESDKDDENEVSDIDLNKI